jgi:hypothetical protein
MNSFDFLSTYNRELGCWVDSHGRPTTEKDVDSPVETERKLKPTFLGKIDDVKNLKSINGLSIEQIEQRARPGGYSYSGFIGKDEKFIDVLLKDWETVEKLQVTHEELASHLRNILSLGESIRKISLKASMGPIILDYKVSDFDENTIVAEGAQTLEVALLSTRGFQEDIFAPLKEDLREVDTPNQWNEEDVIRNKHNGVELRVNSGVLSYIREFGFYEGGGDDNPYRVDPKKIMSLLTGK